MNRRDLLTRLGGAAVLRPVSAHAQQPGKVYRIAGVHPSRSPVFWTKQEAHGTGDLFLTSCARPGARRAGVSRQ